MNARGARATHETVDRCDLSILQRLQARIRSRQVDSKWPIDTAEAWRVSAASGNNQSAQQLKELAGLTALSASFAVGALARLSATALLFPQSALDVLWRLSPDAKIGLQSIHPWGMWLMTLVCAACAPCAGVWTRAAWGRRTAILLVNFIGDTTNAIVRHDLRTLIGLPIGGALIAYLASRRVRGECRDPRGGGSRVATAKLSADRARSRNG